jgi:tRNA pseudouridine32 synthase/23S rRNA pseudouridine746 synthase
MSVPASTFTVAPDEAAPLLNVLAARFPGIPRATWEDRCALGRVQDEGGLPLPAHHPCRPGQRIQYFRDVAEEAEPTDLERVVFEDAHLLVADKPHRMAVTPSGRHLRHCLLYRLRTRPGGEGLNPVHRLDRDTAGLVVFAKTPEALSVLGRAFDDRSVAKTYEALARVPEGTRPQCWSVVNRLHPGDPFFTMRAVDGPPNSRTRIELVEEAGGLGRFRLQPVTGRKHQLRVHMAGLGFPILNDPCYPECLSWEDSLQGPPLQLLATELAFAHPITGEPLHLRSERHLAG